MIHRRRSVNDIDRVVRWGPVGMGRLIDGHNASMLISLLGLIVAVRHSDNGRTITRILWDLGRPSCGQECTSRMPLGGLFVSRDVLDERAKLLLDRRRAPRVSGEEADMCLLARVVPLSVFAIRWE